MHTPRFLAIRMRRRCNSVALPCRRTIRRWSGTLDCSRPPSVRSRSTRTARGCRSSSVRRRRCPCSSCTRALGSAVAAPGAVRAQLARPVARARRSTGSCAAAATPTGAPARLSTRPGCSSFTAGVGSGVATVRVAEPQDERVTRNRIAVERVSVFIKAVMLTPAAGTWGGPRRSWASRSEDCRSPRRQASRACSKRGCDRSHFRTPHSSRPR